MRPNSLVGRIGSIPALFALPLLALGGCGPSADAGSAVPDSEDVATVDIDQRLDQYATVRLAADVSALSPEDQEIVRILSPGGLVYTSTLFSWRYHPCRIDYWRYTPEALALLMRGTDTIDQGFDATERRRDVRKKAAEDPMPFDALGGWRENVRVFHAGVKPRRRPA